MLSERAHTLHASANALKHRASLRSALEGFKTLAHGSDRLTNALNRLDGLETTGHAEQNRDSRTKRLNQRSCGTQQVTQTLTNSW